MGNHYIEELFVNKEKNMEFFHRIKVPSVIALSSRPGGLHIKYAYYKDSSTIKYIRFGEQPERASMHSLNAQFWDYAVARALILTPTLYLKKNAIRGFFESTKIKF